MAVKYPDIHVQLVGNDGNAYTIMALVVQGLRRGGVEAGEVSKFRKEAMSGDYDHLLQTAMKWVDVD